MQTREFAGDQFGNFRGCNESCSSFKQYWRTLCDQHSHLIFTLIRFLFNHIFFHVFAVRLCFHSSHFFFLYFHLLYPDFLQLFRPGRPLCDGSILFRLDGPYLPELLLLLWSGSQLRSSSPAGLTRLAAGQRLLIQSDLIRLRYGSPETCCWQ